MNNCFLDIDYARINKKTQQVGGDVFLSRKDKAEGRSVSVLSDGLGSGIKANVLATLTTSMAAGCIEGMISIERTAEVIMNSLPVCSKRKISYATFTIIDIDFTGNTRIIEYDNPPFLLIRKGELVETPKKRITFNGTEKRNTIYSSSFQLQENDRIVVFSDGVPQSGIGNKAFPLGWEFSPAAEWILGVLGKKPALSARELSRAVVNRSVQNDIYTARDDITCAVLHARRPRKILIVSGPPLHAERDRELTDRVTGFQGKIIICGGTTANIISRELGRKIKTDITSLDSELPPTSKMEGIDLVTEGIFTLERTAKLLEQEEHRIREKNGATEIIELLRESDEIEFLVGTRINNAHQDPNIPVGLEIRRNIVSRIGKILTEKLLKEVKVSYI
ncbi:MAG: SpoIIE family protein phosphatase [Spirochaetia bacterium]